MGSRQDRPKANELLRQGGAPLVGGLTTFDKAFPTIQGGTVVVTQEQGYGHDRQTYSYDVKTVGQYIDCRRTLCYGGGFDIGSLLHELVREGQTETEATDTCKGYEGSPKGRRDYGPCLNWFEVKVTLKYKS